MPRLQALQTLTDEAARREVARDLGVPPKKKIVLFALGNMAPHAYFHLNYLQIEKQRVCREMLEQLSRLARKRQDLHVIVKLKPSASDPAESLRREWGVLEHESFQLEGRPYDMATLVRACDLVAHSYSTVAYEAMLAKKPVICVNGPEEFSGWEFLGEGVEQVYLPDADTLEPLVEKMLYDESFRKAYFARVSDYLAAFHSKQDLHVQERVLQLIQNGSD